MTKDHATINPECALRLKAVLIAQKKTQASLAEDTGYSVPYISYILNGKQPLTAKCAKEFSKVLGIRQEYLLCEDDCKTPEEFQELTKRKLWSDSLNQKIEFDIAKIAGLIAQNIEINNEGLYISKEDRLEFRKDISDYIQMRTEKWLIPRLKEKSSDPD